MKSFNFYRKTSTPLYQNKWVTLKLTNSSNFNYFKYNFTNNFSQRNYTQHFDNKDNNNDIFFDELVRKGWLRLKEKGIENSFFEANLLLSKILNKRYPHKNTKISTEQQQRYEEFISRREKWEPIAYIIEEKEFYGRIFKCKRKETLIPRPDSELFVDFSIKLFNSFYFDFIKEMKIIEGGVGTGALIVSIVAEINQLQKLEDQKRSNKDIPIVSAVGVDIHPPALLIAQQNILFHQLQNQIQLISSDWFTEIKDISNYQIILANPPYITEEEMKSLHPTVKLWEPHIALNGGEDGLSHYRKISNQLAIIERAKRKEETLFVLLEIGFSQAADLVRLFEENNKNLRFVKVEKDLSSLDRLVVFTNNFDLNFDYL